MSDKRKKIPMRDESGMLSKEVLLGYIHGELSPMARAEVDAIIAENEVYNDIIEGLRLIPDKAKTERELSDLEERIAQRAGITRRTTGIPLYQYRNVAAVAVSALLVVSVVWFAVNLMTTDKTGMVAENQTKEEPIAELQMKEPKQDKPESTFGSPVQETEPDDVDALMELEEELEPVIDAVEEPELEKEKKSEDFGNIRQGSERNKAKEINEARSTDKPETKIIAKQEEKNAREEAPGDYYVDGVMVGKNESAARVADSNEFEDAFSRKAEAQSLVASGAESEQTVFLFDQVEEIPTFPGDQQGLITYLQKNLNYPRKAKKNDIEGTVFLTFVITKNGQVSQVKVIQGVDQDLDQEAKRVVEKMPPWNPGKQNGKPVPVKYTLPVKFELPD